MLPRINKKLLSKHSWRCKARVDNYERVSETSTVGNKLPSDNLLLSNSLVSLNSANNNVDKCNKDFDPHENEKKECVFTVTVEESLKHHVV